MSKGEKETWVYGRSVCHLRRVHETTTDDRWMDYPWTLQNASTARHSAFAAALHAHYWATGSLVHWAAARVLAMPAMRASPAPVNFLHRRRRCLHVRRRGRSSGPPFQLHAKQISRCVSKPSGSYLHFSCLNFWDGRRTRQMDALILFPFCLFCCEEEQTTKPGAHLLVCIDTVPRHLK